MKMIAAMMRMIHGSSAPRSRDGPAAVHTNPPRMPPAEIAFRPEQHAFSFDGAWPSPAQPWLPGLPAQPCWVAAHVPSPQQTVSCPFVMSLHERSWCVPSPSQHFPDGHVGNWAWDCWQWNVESQKYPAKQSLEVQHCTVVETALHCPLMHCWEPYCLALQVGGVWVHCQSNEHD